MIVRDVLKCPELLDSFDWFNDGDDTIRWLRGFSLASYGRPPNQEAVALAEVMKLRSKQYFTKRAERHSQ